MLTYFLFNTLIYSSRRHTNREKEKEREYHSETRKERTQPLSLKSTSPTSLCCTVFHSPRHKNLFLTLFLPLSLSILSMSLSSLTLQFKLSVALGRGGLGDDYGGARVGCVGWVWVLRRSIVLDWVWVLRRSMTLGWIWGLPNVVVIDSPMSAKSISVAMATAKVTAEARRLTAMA